MNLVWLRNDLRLDDNPALWHACRNQRGVKAVYIATPNQWQQHNEAPVKIGFKSAALQSLQNQLAGLGIALELLQCPGFGEVAGLLASYCREHGIKTLFFNREVPFDEQTRDQQVISALSALGIDCQSFNSDLLVDEPVLTKQGQPYRVFTPWYRAWLQQLGAAYNSPLPKPEAVSAPLPQDKGQLDLPGGRNFREDLWPASEQAALERLAKFTNRRLRHYEERRDYPAINGTSTLSPYLASGLVSPSRCLMAIQQTAHEQGWDWHESVWLRELGWREFYRYLLRWFPDLNKGRPFKQQPQKWPWQPNAEILEAWQTGQTGFPIIDAAIQQLLKTGWMHNRLRMITASFLCKLLLIDWREGERFFMQHLIDGDFASNNGGWQWSASTGCDAAPWFRIFNPMTQSSKFDPQGDFIRKCLPQLRALDSKQIHNPTAEQRAELGYPAPIIDYQWARNRALEQFK